jgi:hypothetical protein
MKTHTFIIALFCWILLASCSYKTRFANLIAKHPDLQKTDTTYITKTIVVHDTVTIEPESTHAHLNGDFSHATITTKDSNVIVTINKTFDKNGIPGYDVNVNKKGQTIIITKEVTIKQPVVTIRYFIKQPWYKDSFFYLMLLFLGSWLFTMRAYLVKPQN